MFISMPWDPVAKAVAAGETMELREFLGMPFRGRKRGGALRLWGV